MKAERVDKTIRYLKLGVFLCMVVALALPVSSCSKVVDRYGADVGLLGQGPEGPETKVVTQYRYALDQLSVRDPSSWLEPLLFLWPLPILACTIARPASLLSRLLWVVEPIAACLAGYFIYCTSHVFSEPEIGAHVYVGANAMYLATWLYELVVVIRRRRRKLEPNFRVKRTRASESVVNTASR